MIRPYKNNDQKKLLNLLKLNTPEFFDSSEEKDFIEYLLLHAQNYFVVEEDHRLVACGGINFGFDDGKTARISWDIVHSDEQRKGIGKELVLFRINEIKKNPYVNKIVVRTTQLVFGFYQNVGFTLDKVEEGYWSPEFDLYEMSMKI